MKVLQVSDVDLPGRHFNGYDLLDDLAPHHIECSMAVLRKLSNHPRVRSLFSNPGDEDLQHRLRKVEHKHSLNNLLFPWARVLAATAEFASADVVHYHLIHNNVLSLYDIEWLFALKPSIWTFHDPWPMTGHCIHPMGCDGWLRGCAPCPFLDRTFPLTEDRAGQLWDIKHRVYSKLDVDVVVASNWMLDMVRRSALTSGFSRVHRIPFGVDGRAFLPDERKAESRRRLGLRPRDFVVFLRAQSWEAKGLQHFVEAMAAKPPSRPTTILTVDERGLLTNLENDYRVIELGWIDDALEYPLPFSACDVFVMPSLAEAFGLMAVEAMAAGRPVICFEGTALPATTHAPACGIAVSTGDVLGLRDAMDRLAADPAEAAARGLLGRAIAAEEYGYERYLDSMAALYRSVFDRHRGSN